MVMHAPEPELLHSLGGITYSPFVLIIMYSCMCSKLVRCDRILATGGISTHFIEGSAVVFPFDQNFACPKRRLVLLATATLLKLLWKVS